MAVLKLTWTFRSPTVVSPHPIHLDSLLARAKVDRAIQFRTNPEPYTEQENLPLEQVGGVWKASQLVFTPLGEVSLMPFIRKASLMDFSADYGEKYEAGRKLSFTIATGKFKCFDMRLPVQSMEKAVAWCHGDRAQIEDLLKDFVTIGKKHENGMGRVKSLVIEECPSNETEFWRIRALPEKSGLELAGVDYTPAVGRCRAPYWDKTQQEIILLPNLSAK